jgi:hypothetical protein
MRTLEAMRAAAATDALAFRYEGRVLNRLPEVVMSGRISAPCYARTERWLDLQISVCIISAHDRY